MTNLVYIAHQLAGNVSENVRSILKICKEVHTQDTIPIAPYLVAVQYLNDHLEEERELGIAVNIAHFRRRVMDETWLCGPRISTGMKEEIKLSLKYEIPIRCYNPEFSSELETIVEQYNQGLSKS